MIRRKMNVVNGLPGQYNFQESPMPKVAVKTRLAGAKYRARGLVYGCLAVIFGGLAAYSVYKAVALDSEGWMYTCFVFAGLFVFVFVLDTINGVRAYIKGVQL